MRLVVVGQYRARGERGQVFGKEFKTFHLRHGRNFIEAYLCHFVEGVRIGYILMEFRAWPDIEARKIIRIITRPADTASAVFIFRVYVVGVMTDKSG